MKLVHWIIGILAGAVSVLGVILYQMTKHKQAAALAARAAEAAHAPIIRAAEEKIAELQKENSGDLLEVAKLHAELAKATEALHETYKKTDMPLSEVVERFRKIQRPVSG